MTWHPRYGLMIAVPPSVWSFWIGVRGVAPHMVIAAWLWLAAEVLV
jgi:hypothetical protein